MQSQRQSPRRQDRLWAKLRFCQALFCQMLPSFEASAGSGPYELLSRYLLSGFAGIGRVAGMSLRLGSRRPNLGGRRQPSGAHLNGWSLHAARRYWLQTILRPKRFDPTHFYATTLRKKRSPE